MSVCLSPLIRSQFSVNFDKTLHHRLEPENYDRVRWDQSLTIPYFIILNRVYLRSGGESVEHLKDATKLADPSYHDTGTNFSSTVKFADPDYPLLGPGMGSYLPHKRSY